jgi:hypothetical protein
MSLQLTRFSLVVATLVVALAEGCSAAPAGTAATEAAPAAAATKAAPSDVARAGEEEWRRSLTKAMSTTPLPQDGCFQVTRPSTTWVRVPCATPPDITYQPGSGPIAQTLGGGSDPIAQNASVISWAEGSFPSVLGVVSENDGPTANSYSLQLNTQKFSAPALCATAQNSACQGLQQFVYSSTPGLALIQYWLTPYTTTNNNCPSGWQPPAKGVNQCFRDSGTVSVPTVLAQNLASVTLTATAGSSDSIIMSISDGNLYATSQPSVLGLNTAWTTAEFNVLGNGGGSRAQFNAGSTIVVQTLTDVPSTAGPACLMGGSTTETNNMSLLPGSCGPFGGDLPGMLFTESYNGPAMAAAAQPAIAELGFEQISADFNDDGVEDTIIVDANGSYEYLGSRSGGFTANTWMRTDLTLDTVNYIPGDFNGDGATDLIVVTTSGSYEYTGLKGAGGGFTPNVWSNNLSLGHVSYVPGDFNGDGTTDLIVVTASGSSEYTGLLGGGFNTSAWTQSSLTLGAVNYVPGDFNGDGNEDLIVVTASGSSEYAGSKPGGFTTNVWSLPNQTLGNVNYAVGDFNCDGVSDLIIVDANGSFEYTGLRANGFTPNVWTRSSLTLGQVNYVPGEFSGDQCDDLIIVDANGSFEYTGLRAGGFTSNVWTRTDLTLPVAVYEARDFNGDGKTDLIAQTTTGSVELTGLMGGGFTPNVWTRTNLPGRTASYF